MNKNKIKKEQLDIVGSKYSDVELLNMMNYWLDHYVKYGEKHYYDTPDWKILDIYWDNVLDRVLNELEIEEHEIEPMVDRISALF